MIVKMIRCLGKFPLRQQKENYLSLRSCQLVKKIMLTRSMRKGYVS